ncbi:MAG: hypothetical protein OQK56_01885 [Ignavibacteriaceae bacterium]|jgi:hypothetical protein|nr:hypothetical protein [Ignavibacteriaceae bacterium]MCW9066374.1 hypothetical protein [Ignavibacteriaceae bacterium]
MGENKISVCAIAVEDYLKTNGNSAGKVGSLLSVNYKERVLREGFIYSP